MNLEGNVFVDVNKSIPNFYFDDGLTFENEINMTGVILRSQHSEVQEYFSVDVKKIRPDLYEFYISLQAQCFTFTTRNYVKEYNFQMYQPYPHTNYYIVNDHENCADEFPRENGNLEELDYFNDLLKILFINPPTYIGMMI